MPAELEYVLGVDVGGNHVKMAFVDGQGGMHQFQSFYTKEFVDTGDFTDKLIKTIQYKMLDYGQPCNGIGIGFPGTLTKDRDYTLEIPALANELNGKPTGKQIREAFPTCKVRIENDANAAALGELLFGTNQPPDDFAFVTLGTGIGSAYVQDRKIFIGADGNALAGFWQVA